MVAATAIPFKIFFATTPAATRHTVSLPLK